MTAVIRVTVEDLVDGTTQSVEVPAGDYLLIATPPCYVASTQAYPAKGTHVVTIKGRSVQ